MVNSRNSALVCAPHGGSSWATTLTAVSLGVLSACSGNGTGGGNMNMDMDGSGADMTGGPPIVVTVTRQGTGVVTSQPAGIDCGGAGSCTAMFPSGVPLQLTAQGQQGTAFAGWSGACAGQSAICKLTPAADVNVGANFSPLACTTDGLCWEAPLPFGMNLRDVSAVSANDVWAIGTQGTILHYDGSRWNFTASGTLEDLQGVSASAANNAWIAGGNNGLVLRWNGTNWSSVNTGFTTYTSAVYTSDPTSVIVAELSPNALHFAAAGAWTRRQATLRTAGFIRGISGTAANNVWIYGDDNSVSSWNGTTWTGLARNYAPQGIYTPSAGVAYMQHSTSQMFRIMGTAYQMPPTAPTADVSGTSGIVGLWGINATNIFTSGPPGVLYRFDGTAWSTIQTPAKDVGTFVKGSGVAANDMWLVGPRGTLARWDGTKVTSDRANVFSGDIKSAWGSSATDIWFVTDKATLIHYDGTAYQETPPIVSGFGAALNSISGTSASDIWLCGSEANKAVMFHYDGQAWTRSTVPSLFTVGDTPLDLVFAAGPAAAWAFSNSYVTPIKWNGSKWEIDTLNLTMRAEALWGTGPTNVFAAGGGDMARWDGTSWSRTGMLTVPIHSIAGSSPTDIWAGGDGRVYRWNGTSWGAAMNIAGSVGGLQRIAAISPNDAWFSDLQGALYRWNGAAFRQMNTSMGRPGRPLSIWASNAGVIWFAGTGILTYGR